MPSRLGSGMSYSIIPIPDGSTMITPTAPGGTVSDSSAAASFVSMTMPASP